VPPPYVLAGHSLGGLLVLTAAQTLARFGPELGRMHRELSELSTQGGCRVVAGADHHSIVNDPRHAGEVAAAIEQLLAAQR
jgi:thioesterase domain-containing protein